MQSITSEALRAVADGSLSEGQLDRIAEEVHQLFILATADGRWTELTELGVALTRLAVALEGAPDGRWSSWARLYRFAGHLATGVAAQAGPPADTAKLVATSKGAALVRLLLERHEVPAKVLREALRIPNQSNMSRLMRPLLNARLVVIVEGLQNNSRAYRLTAEGRRQLGALPILEYDATATSSPRFPARRGAIEIVSSRMTDLSDEVKQLLAASSEPRR